MAIIHSSEETIVDSNLLLPGEHKDILVDVQDLIENADDWMATPNSNFGGRSPVELVGTPDESLIRQTLRSVLYSGMV